MEREIGGLRARHPALDEFEEAGLVVESVRNVVKDFKIVVEGGDERSEIAFRRRRNDLVESCSNFFLCRHSACSVLKTNFEAKKRKRAIDGRWFHRSLSTCYANISLKNAAIAFHDRSSASL